jgi:hypothetical protein
MSVCVFGMKVKYIPPEGGKRASPISKWMWCLKLLNTMVDARKHNLHAM